MTGQRGQTSAEIAGLLVLLAAVFLALGGLGLPEAVAGSARTAVCQVLDGDCDAAGTAPEGGATPVSTTTDPGSGGPGDVPPGWPAEGPSLADRPGDFPVLPFAGGVGTSQEAGRTRADVHVTRSDDDVAANGCPTTTLGVNGRVEVLNGTKGKRGRGGSSGQTANGVGVDYTVTTSPSRADEIEAGRDDPPDPIDPGTLQPGESIELGESYYEKAGLSGNYRALRASMGFESGRRLSSGVTRTGEDTVRISVGDSDYVTQSLSAGVGTDKLKVDFGASSTESQGELSTIDLDISTQAGWDAYQAFVGSGTLPEPGAPGTANPRVSDTFGLSSQSKLGAEAGGFSASVPISDASGSRTETRNPDGTIDYSINAKRDSRGFQILDYGDPTREDLYALNFEGVDDTAVDEYNQLNGSSLSEYDEGVRVEYTEEELLDVRDAAVDVYQGYAAEQGIELSDEEVLDGFTYGEQPSDDVSQVNLATAPKGLETLLESETPGDVLLALSGGGGTGSASTAFADLTELSRQAGRFREVDPSEQQVLPGDSLVPDCG